MPTNFIGNFADVSSLFDFVDVPVNLVLTVEHLSVFAFDINTGAPISGLPLFAVAELGPVTRAAEDREQAFQYPLGMVTTDHAGYASFDLSVMRNQQVRRQIQKMYGTRRFIDTIGTLKNPEKPVTPTVQISGLRVLPFGDSAMAIDAMAQGDRGPDFVYLRLDLDQFILAGRPLNRMAVSMQNPSIRDWRLSPASFSMAGVLLIGEDGCETLVPTNLATQAFRFQQLIRLEGPQDDQTDVAGMAAVAAGWVVEFKTEWHPIGHSLGQILYSLPLAPGEKRRIAVLDWSRTEQSSRDESTGLSETLAHHQLRDRTVSETVTLALRESQRGDSFSWGVGLSGGGGGQAGGNTSIGVGASFGIGGGNFNSQGARDLSSESLQRLTDAFHQASAAMRELRSTVLVQAEQQEKGTAQTRVVANYNHSHALTFLYYEVLRHYCVVTGADRLRPAVFVSRARSEFTVERALVHRVALLQALLDPSLKATLDLLLQSRQGDVAVPVAAIDFLLAHLNTHSMHYHRAIWWRETPAQTLDWLASLDLGGRRLDRLVEPVAVDMVGDTYVLPVLRGQESFVAQVLGVSFDTAGFAQDHIEQLLTLPTRGMFAEAKLGHCNASEVIDSTRFWDWQQSPIPDDTSGIADLDLGTPSKTPPATTPSTMPASLLNIVNPPAAPDPSGMAGALATMAALGAFRDMSGREVTGALLSGLLSNSGQLATQGLAGANARAMTQMQNQQTRQLIDTIRNARELTPEQRTQLITRVLGSDVDAVTNASATTSGADPAAAPPPASTGQASSGGTTGTSTSSSPARRTPVSRRSSQPVPTPAQRVSSQTRQLLFVFKFSTNAPMLGSFRVRLQSGNSMVESSGIENTLSNYASANSGATLHDIGNRVIMVVPVGFGGSQDMHIQIEGDMVVDSFEVFTSGADRYVARAPGWTRTVMASQTMTRALFDATRTWDVVMPTVVEEYTVKHQLGHNNASSSSSGTGSSTTTGTTLGGRGVVAEASFNLEHVVSATYENSTTREVSDGYEVSVKYLLTRVSRSQQPTIRPVGSGG